MTAAKSNVGAVTVRAHVSVCTCVPCALMVLRRVMRYPALVGFFASPQGISALAR